MGEEFVYLFLPPEQHVIVYAILRQQLYHLRVEGYLVVTYVLVS